MIADSSQRQGVIILISGPWHEGLEKKVFDALSQFSLSIEEVQKIEMAGRLILALRILLDPAHLDAVEDDLKELITPLQLELASEIL